MNDSRVVLLCAYRWGAPCSRRTGRRLHGDIACRVLAANSTPDLRTISAFREIIWRSQGEVEEMSRQVQHDPSSLRHDPPPSKLLPTGTVNLGRAACAVPPWPFDWPLSVPLAKRRRPVLAMIDMAEGFLDSGFRRNDDWRCETNV